MNEEIDKIEKLIDLSHMSELSRRQFMKGIGSAGPK